SASPAARGWTGGSGSRPEPRPRCRSPLAASRVATDLRDQLWLWRMSSGLFTAAFNRLTLTAFTCPSPKVALKNLLWRPSGRRPPLRQLPQSSCKGTPKSQSTLHLSCQTSGWKVYGPGVGSAHLVQLGDPWSKSGSRDGKETLPTSPASAYITRFAGWMMWAIFAPG